MELEKALETVIGQEAGELSVRRFCKLEKDFGFLQNLMADTDVKQTLIDCRWEYKKALVKQRSKGKPRRAARQPYPKPSAQRRYKDVAAFVHQEFTAQVVETLEPITAELKAAIEAEGSMISMDPTSFRLRIGKRKRALVQKKVDLSRVLEKWNTLHPQAPIPTTGALSKSYRRARKRIGYNSNWKFDAERLLALVGRSERLRYAFQVGEE
jgi:hypothetical protein